MRLGGGRGEFGRWRGGGGEGGGEVVGRVEGRVDKRQKREIEEKER